MPPLRVDGLNIAHLLGMRDRKKSSFYVVDFMKKYEV